MTFLIISSSCEDFLEEKDYSNITGDSFYPTEKGIESLVNACYTPLRFYYGKEFSLVYTELGTDIITAGNGAIDNPYTYYRNDMVRLTDKGTDKNSDYWRYFYLGLNNANSAVARVPVSALPIVTRKIREGEVLFLRAFYLWHIVNIWGGVHFTTEESTEAVSELNMTDENVFFNQIIEDLRKAIPLLPITTTEYGRVTKPAAQAFLARTYLYVKDYSNAYAYADTVINDYGFDLLDDFSDLWDVNNDKNNEVIWSVIWSENDEYSKTILEGQQDKDGSDQEWFERAPGNQMHMFFGMTYDKLTINGQTPVKRDIENGRPFNRLIPTRFLLDLYNEAIDSRYRKTFKTVWYANNVVYPDSTDINGDAVLVNGKKVLSKVPMIEIGDTAIFVTKDVIPDEINAQKPYLIFDRENLFESDGTPVGTRQTNFSLRKFDDPTRDPLDANDQSSKFDVYVFRLAEMYFIAAEAQMYLGNNQAAADLINVVRRRAAVDGMESLMEVTAGDMNIDFILDEKAREFAGEYVRWFDLKRTGKLIERVRLHNNDAALNIQPYHVNRPIPENELNAVTNKNVFKQHEGYN